MLDFNILGKPSRGRKPGPRQGREEPGLAPDPGWSGFISFREFRVVLSFFRGLS